jgi:hypothetical protein
VVKPGAKAVPQNNLKSGKKRGLSPTKDKVYYNY